MPRKSARKRVLVLRAGSPSTNNLIRSLRAGDPSCVIVGCHHDGFELKKSLADRNFLVRASPRRELARALHQIVELERIDIVIPNSEPDVAIVSDLRKALGCRTFVPGKSVLERCRDKYALTTFLRERGLPVPETYPVLSTRDIPRVFRRLPPASRLWCRIRRGSGSVGAIPVETPAQVRGWIHYWEQMRGIPRGSFTLSEFLPGRDLTVQCLLRGGVPLMSKTHEKLSYHVLAGVPSGVSSTASLAKIIHEPHALRVSIEAIRALDRDASGVFFVDLKENPYGEPRITEINAGRFANVPTIHDAYGGDNMVHMYVRAAFGEAIETVDARAHEGDYVLRSLDMSPVVLRGAELFDEIRDLR
jgi:hypothetical protein